MNTQQQEELDLLAKKVRESKMKYDRVKGAIRAKKRELELLAKKVDEAKWEYQWAKKAQQEETREERIHREYIERQRERGFYCEPYVIKRDEFDDDIPIEILQNQ